MLGGTHTSLVANLARRLESADSGVDFIRWCLTELIEVFDVESASAVIDDPVVGPRVFTVGARVDVPVEPGIYTRPAVSTGFDQFAGIAALCAVALTLDRVRHDAAHDLLTGLCNRRAFEEHLCRSVSHSVRVGSPVALVLLDLDGFKVVNDQMGHPAGDIVLRRVATRLRQGVRSSDVAARVGGDEFALLLHDVTRQSVSHVLRRLASTAVWTSEPPTPIRWSTGVAWCPFEGSSPTALYRLADRRLYTAKPESNHRLGERRPAATEKS